MVKFIIIFIVLNLYSSAFSSSKEKIISKIKITNNFSFDFIQNIDGKKEKGNCVIKYSKKIFCEYNNSNKKIVVSDGKSLVIKNRNSGNYSIYSLKRTPLELLLNKDYLISQINILEPRDINNKYLNFMLFEENNKINIFFDKKSFNLAGWQTEDIYQNLVITFISSVKINQEIDDDIFILPKNN
tara:strand:+ start:120 stop:674 length:555 start_codon:yes stop_codon:yes gene_type:complete